MTLQEAPVSSAIPNSVGDAEPRLPGNAGMWLFVIGDLFIFGAYFVIFMVHRHWDPAGFLASQRHLNLGAGVLNTLVLLTSSYFVAQAVGATRRRDIRRASLLLNGAGACALVFIAIKAYEWTRLMHEGYTFAHNNFFMFFFALTGVHLFHILMGFVVLGVVRHELHTQQARGRVVEAGAIYWHMVDLIWVVLFALLYVMR
jgi:nitric oxide reductase NorE protein